MHIFSGTYYGEAVAGGHERITACRLRLIRGEMRVLRNARTSGWSLSKTALGIGVHGNGAIPGTRFQRPLPGESSGNSPRRVAAAVSVHVARQGPRNLELDHVPVRRRSLSSLRIANKQPSATRTSSPLLFQNWKHTIRLLRASAPSFARVEPEPTQVVSPYRIA